MLHSYWYGHWFHWMRGLTAPDVATMVALVVIMVIFKHNDEEQDGHAQYFVIVVVTLGVAAWMAFSDGWSALVRYAGLYVVCGAGLLFSESFKALGAGLAAAALVAANAGCSHLMH